MKELGIDSAYEIDALNGTGYPPVLAIEML
jgi:hypothetical protein